MKRHTISRKVRLANIRFLAETYAEGKRTQEEMGNFYNCM